MRNRIKRAVIIGNSLAGMMWLERQGMCLQAQMKQQLLDIGIELQSFPRKTSPANQSACYQHLLEHLRGGTPDIILFQGAWEQAIANTATTSITAPAGPGAQSLTLNASLASPTVTRLGDDNDNEWVQILAVDGSRVRRGLFGTSPKFWPAGTPILHNSNSLNWNEGCDLQREFMRQIARMVDRYSSDNLPIVLFHDYWSGGNNSVTSGMRALVDSMGIPNVGFVAFDKGPDLDNARIASDPTNVGPTAQITAVSAGAGTPPQLTITCNNTKGVQNLREGQYVALWDVSAAPLPNNASAWEYVQIGSVDYDAKTFVVPTANRQKFGSATAQANLGDGDIVAAISPSGFQLRDRIDTIGTVNTLNAAWGGHPIDGWYYWWAKSAVAEIDRLLKAMRL